MCGNFNVDDVMYFSRINFGPRGFYFVQFHPNWRIIVVDFLVNGEILKEERSKWKGFQTWIVLEVLKKIHFDLQT